jgi:DNA-binding transcriptional MerR regulator/methylmalonyl-CoA mutase cobalamin-binding subunit
VDAIHSIQAVARQTGLSPHVIRVWERRYGAVKPVRTDANRRNYSDRDVSRLVLLHQATQAGHSIGQIARLPDERLAQLASAVPAPVAGRVAALDDVDQLVQQALGAVTRLDAAGLQALLSRASLGLGQRGLLQRLIVPLIEHIGEAWQEGRLRPAHEHVATAVIRSYVGGFSRPYMQSDDAPRLIVSTPSGQLHELGAVLAAATANELGWNVTYLGPSLPAEEIAIAAVQAKARAVAISLVYPEDDARLPEELRRLHSLLPKAVTLLIGGRAAPAYASVLKTLGLDPIQDLPELARQLTALRKLPVDEPHK